MTENERHLSNEIIRLEAEKDDLLKRLQWAEEENFQRYIEIRVLMKKIKELERISEFYD